MRSRIDNDKGFSLIELMIVTAISAVLMGAAISVFTKERKLLDNENATTNVRAKGRQAMMELAKEIRRAGFGFPRGAGLITATSSSISFYVDTDNVKTTITSDVTAGQLILPVGSSTGFAGNDNVIIFDAQPGTGVAVSAANWEIKTINSIASNNITLTAGATNAYSKEHGIMFSKYHTMTYTYDSAAKIIYQQIDGGTQIPVVSDVDTFSFVYYDNAGATTATLASITRVQVNLTMQDPSNTVTATAFKTDVNLRNSSRL
jgi:prepilin-type N-terminal cleavage/methylation domain-containing protein